MKGGGNNGGMENVGGKRRRQSGGAGEEVENAHERVRTEEERKMGKDKECRKKKT